MRVCVCVREKERESVCMYVCIYAWRASGYQCAQTGEKHHRKRALCSRKQTVYLHNKILLQIAHSQGVMVWILIIFVNRWNSLQKSSIFPQDSSITEFPCPMGRRHHQTRGCSSPWALPFSPAQLQCVAVYCSMLQSVAECFRDE